MLVRLLRAAEEGTSPADSSVVLLDERGIGSELERFAFNEQRLASGGKDGDDDDVNTAAAAAEASDCVEEAEPCIEVKQHRNETSQRDKHFLRTTGYTRNNTLSHRVRTVDVSEPQRQRCG